MARNSSRFKFWAGVVVLLPLFASLSAAAQAQAWTLIWGGDVCPALWMLGANTSALNLPSCGEMDVREYTGRAAATSQNRVSLHWIGSTSSHVTYNIDRSRDSEVAPQPAVLFKINQKLIVPVKDDAEIDGIEVEKIANSSLTMKNTPELLTNGAGPTLRVCRAPRLKI